MSLPKPYYQDDWCQIFCADCREILPELPKVDVAVERLRQEVFTL